LMVLIGSCPVAQSLAGAAETGEVLATIGNDPITRQDLENQLKNFPASFREQFEAEDGREHLLKELVRIEVFAREGESLRLNESERFKVKLRAITKALLAEEYSRQKVFAEIAPGDQEIRQYYQDHQDQFMAPERILAPSIFIDLPAGAMPEESAKEEAKANEVMTRLQSGEDPGLVAESLSERGYKEEPEYFARGRLVPEIEESVFKLKINEVSPILRVDGGLLIFKLEDKIPERLMPYEEVRGKIIERVRKEKQARNFEETEQRLFGKYQVTFKSSKKPGAGEPVAPANAEHTAMIVGKIVQIFKADAQSQRQGELGRVVMDEDKGSASAYGQASITLSKDTTLFQRTGSDLKPADFDRLKVGQWVEINIVGAAAASYPVQAVARQAIILEGSP
jgi:peptidyl-prolyl cis-trans isomerase C